MSAKLHLSPQLDGNALKTPFYLINQKLTVLSCEGRHHSCYLYANALPGPRANCPARPISHVYLHCLDAPRQVWARCGRVLTITDLKRARGAAALLHGGAWSRQPPSHLPPLLQHRGQPARGVRGHHCPFRSTRRLATISRRRLGRPSSRNPAWGLMWAGWPRPARPLGEIACSPCTLASVRRPIQLPQTQPSHL